MIREAILAVLMGLPAWYEDAGEPRAARLELLGPVASAIAGASGGDHQRAAALIALGWHESKFGRYVLEGRCSDGPPGARCDNGRARGAWQLWAVACPAAYQYPAGSLESLELEARCADRLLQGARGRCRGRHPAGALAGAFSGYRGLDCRWPGGAGRARTAEAVLFELYRAGELR